VPRREVPAPDGLDAVAGLADPVRRRCYRVVLASREPAGKDEVAAAAGISRSLAAYHLDHLAEAGLLRTSYARRTGRSGPGAGRPAKLYERGPDELCVQLPARDDTLLAGLLAAALEAAKSDVARDALLSGARAEGARASDELAGGGEQALLRVLAERGYEPYVEGDEIRLHNCPFHHLVGKHRELVCGLNFALLDAAVGSCPGYCAVLEPHDERCCVTLRRE
jgi:predicted ArsR family transcriptional regulator